MTKKAPATKDGLASLKPRKITGKAGDSIRGGTEVSKKV